MKKVKKVSYSGKIVKRNRKRKLLKILILVVLLILMCAGFIFTMRADFLQIKNIEVEGAVSVKSKAVQQTAEDFLAGTYLGLLPKSNVLLAPTGKIESAIVRKFGKIKTVNASRNVEGKIQIKIEEKEAVAVWCALETGCFLVDSDGLLYARASEEELAGKIVLSGGVENEPLQKTFASEGQVQNFFELFRILRSGGVETESLTYESENKVVLNTSLTQIFILPNETNVLETGENILLLMETERKKNPNAEFEYIDARFGNKLFYKTF